MYNSLVFSIFIRLCNHYNCLIQKKLFNCLIQKKPHSISMIPHSPFPSPLLLLLLLSLFSRVRLCATPQTAARQAPPSLGFSRQEHWSGLPFPSPMQESEK